MAMHLDSQQFHSILKELGELHDRKQRDYGRDNAPFANVEASADWGMPAWIGAMVRATDKLRRLQTLAQTGTLSNEGAIDSFNDLAIYAIIARILYEKMQTERDVWETTQSIADVSCQGKSKSAATVNGKLWSTLDSDQEVYTHFQRASERSRGVTPVGIQNPDCDIVGCRTCEENSKNRA